MTHALFFRIFESRASLAKLLKMEREPMNISNKKTIILASVLGAITIAIGAFGAHGLKQLVSPEAVVSFETGVRYQMYHVFAILILGATNFLPLVDLKWVIRLFVGGIVLFSGSIYLLAMKDYTPFSVKFLGPVTPLGGLMFIGGWSYLAYAVGKLKSR